MTKGRDFSNLSVVTLLFKKNYLTQIENSVKGENHLFRNFYIVQDGIEKDALENGGLSCSAFASSILYLFNPLLEFLGKPHWIGLTHANTKSSIKDMLEHDWYETKDLRQGAVLVWEEEEFPHMGFYVGNDEAISNDSKGTGFPHKHHFTYNGTRKIEKIYWHDDLNNG